VASTLFGQLRVPFVAVELDTGDAVVEARVPATRAPVDRFPLAFQGEQLGSLVVARRTEREPFRASERELLARFARQAGVDRPQPALGKHFSSHARCS